MRRFTLQRWSVIVLILVRLVLGESAHAMPHSTMSQELVAPAATEMCPDHPAIAAANQAGPSDAGYPGSLDNQGSTSVPEDNRDCCKGGCPCPCAHLSALAIFVVSASPLPISTATTLIERTAASGPDVSGIFRPPA